MKQSWKHLIFLFFFIPLIIVSCQVKDEDIDEIFCYELTGDFRITNECDGGLAVMPNKVIVKAGLYNDNESIVIKREKGYVAGARDK